MDFNFFKKDKNKEEKPSPNRQRKKIDETDNLAFSNQVQTLKKNLEELGMQYSQEEITASVKSCPGDNNSAIEKLLNGEFTMFGGNKANQKEILREAAIAQQKKEELASQQAIAESIN